MFEKEVTNHMDRSTVACDCERLFEWRKWISEIPEIQFPSDWKIKMVPPVGGVLVRFHVITEFIHISVYLDAYDMMGCMNMEPYWEIHPSDDDDCERVMMNNVDGLIDAIKRSIEYHKPEDVL